MKVYSNILDKKKASVWEIYPFILLIVLVGMILAVGMIVMDKFGSSIFYTRTNYNDTVTIANYTAQQLDWGNITVNAVWNSTANILPSACYTINSTPGYFIWDNGSNSCWVDAQTSFYVLYDYKDYATATATATTSVTKELGKISTDWIGLIITIVILSIILALVLRSFNPNVGR